jgi:hypothetical protein
MLKYVNLLRMKFVKFFKNFKLRLSSVRSKGLRFAFKKIIMMLSRKFKKYCMLIIRRVKLKFIARVKNRLISSILLFKNI